MAKKAMKKREALAEVLTALDGLDKAAISRVLKAAMIFHELSIGNAIAVPAPIIIDRPWYPYRGAWGSITAPPQTTGYAMNSAPGRPTPGLLCSSLLEDAKSLESPASTDPLMTQRG